MLTARQQHCLDGIGITIWKTRSSAMKPADERVGEQLIEPLNAAANELPAAAPSHTSTPAVRTKTTYPELADWSQLLGAIHACKDCELASSCTRKVPGKGSQQAELMIIGEAPGHDEDLQGLPFVGRAGQLLDKMLKSIELDLNSVYITNILKCRPPNNRDPKVEEVRACSRFLQAQIKLIKPRILLSVGRVSAQNLLLNQTPLGRLRGQQHRLPDSDIPLLVTYHPAYLLRNPAEKSKAWEDLKTLRHMLQHATD